MAEKKGNKQKSSSTKKGKRKGLKNDGMTIATAVTPSVAITASPRSSPVPKQDVSTTMNSGLASTVLNSSIMHRFFSPPDHDIEIHTDTDTTLYDYANARSPSPYDTIERRGDWRTSPDPPLPPEGFRGDDSEDDLDGDISPPVPQKVDNLLEGLYSSVNKTSLERNVLETVVKKQSPIHTTVEVHEVEKKATVDSDSITSVTEDNNSFEEAPIENQEVNTLGNRSTTPFSFHSDKPELSRNSPTATKSQWPRSRDATDDVRLSYGSRGSRVSKSSLNVTKSSLKSTMRSIEDQIIPSTRVSFEQASGALSPGEATLPLGQTDLLSTLSTSPKIAQLREKTERLEREIEELRERDRSRGHEESGLDDDEPSQVQSTLQSVTIDKQDEYIKNLKNEMIAKDREWMNILERVKILERGRSEPQQQTPRTSRNMIKGLQDQVDKLTKELSDYQLHYKPPPRSQELFPDGRSVPSWWIDPRYLSPLFLEYDERLKEFSRYKEGFFKLKEELQIIIEENNRLHIRLEQEAGGEPITMSEWKKMQEHCKLVIEENQLLLEQLDVQQGKERDIIAAHSYEINKITKQFTESKAVKEALQIEVKELRDKCVTLKKSLDDALIDAQCNVPHDEHSKAIAEFKQKRSEELDKWESEKNILRDKLSEAVTEKTTAVVKAEDLEFVNKQLRNEIKQLSKHLRKSRRKVELMQHILKQADLKGQSIEQYLQAVVKAAERAAFERDSLKKTVHHKEKERQKILKENFLIEKQKLVNKEKLKSVKLKAEEKIEEVCESLKEKDIEMKKLSDQYEREMRHLRLLIRDKESELERTRCEKESLEQDLEQVWKSTMEENRRLRIESKKSELSQADRSAKTITEKDESST